MFKVALLILLSKYTIGYNEVTIVALFPVVKAKDEYTDVVDVSGVKRLAAAKMAIDHINNKNDGYYDYLDTPIVKFLFYDSKRTSDRSWWNIAQLSPVYKANHNNTYFVLGPASSSPTIAANKALHEGKISVPQIAYSASSTSLSGTDSKLFTRTVPNDALKAKILHDLILQENIYFPCIIHGDDSYSNSLAESLIANYENTNLRRTKAIDDDPIFLKGARNEIKTKLRISKFSTSRTATNSSLHSIFRALGSRSKIDYNQIFTTCNTIILFAQEIDGRHIIEHIIRNNKGGREIMLYSTETITGMFLEYVESGADEAKHLYNFQIIDTALPVENPQYKRLAQAWHNRAKDCSLVDDRDGSCLMGKPKPLFIPEDYGNNMNVCVAFNYSEYTVGSYGTEVSGPGYIDSHVPFAYDAAIAIAHAVNFNINHSAMNKAEKGRFFHERLQNVTFDGFSGRVRFTNGDRAEETVKWSIFSFENAVLNIKKCTQSESGRYTTVSESKNPSFTPFQPTCTAMNLAFNASCNPKSEYITDLEVSRRYCKCYDDDKKCPNCCKVDIQEYKGKLKNDEDGYKYSCSYTPAGSSVGILMYCTASLAIILDITGIVCLLIFRKNKIVKNNQASLLIFMLVGSILLSSFTFFGIGYPKKWYCVFSMWLFHLGLPMILISMYVRVWRIHTIFNNKN